MSDRRSPKFPVFLNNVRWDIIFILLSPLRRDFRFFILLLLCSFRSFIFFLVDERQEVDRSFRARPMRTKLHTNETTFVNRTR